MFGAEGEVFPDAAPVEGELIVAAGGPDDDEAAVGVLSDGGIEVDGEVVGEGDGGHPFLALFAPDEDAVALGVVRPRLWAGGGLGTGGDEGGPQTAVGALCESGEAVVEGLAVERLGDLLNGADGGERGALGFRDGLEEDSGGEAAED